MGDNSTERLSGYESVGDGCQSPSGEACGFCVLTCFKKIRSWITSKCSQSNQTDPEEQKPLLGNETKSSSYGDSVVVPRQSSTPNEFPCNSGHVGSNSPTE